MAAPRRVKVHSGSNPPPDEVRDSSAYDDVFWESPGGKLKYNRETKKWDKDVGQMRPPTMGETAEKEGTKPAAAAPAGKVQPTTIAQQGAEANRAKAEEATRNATMQEDVANRGEMGGLGIAQRGRVNAWLKANPGKTTADARKALGFSADTQKKALSQ